MAGQTRFATQEEAVAAAPEGEFFDIEGVPYIKQGGKLVPYKPGAKREVSMSAKNMTPVPKGRTPGRLNLPAPSFNVPPETAQAAQDAAKPAAGETPHLDDILTSLVLSQLQQEKPLSTGKRVLQDLYASPLGGNPAGGPLLAMIMGLTDTPMPAGTGHGRGQTINIGGAGGSGSTMNSIIDALAKIQGMTLAKNKDVRAGLKSNREELQAGLLTPPEQRQAALNKGGLTMSEYEKASLGLKQEVEGMKLRLQEAGLDNQKINTALHEMEVRISALHAGIATGKYDMEKQLFPAKLADLQAKDPTFQKMMELVRVAPKEQKDDLTRQAMQYYSEKTGVPLEMSNSFLQDIMSGNFREAFGGAPPPKSMLPGGQPSPTGTPVPTPTPGPSDPIGQMLDTMRQNGQLQ